MCDRRRLVFSLVTSLSVHRDPWYITNNNTQNFTVSRKTGVCCEQIVPDRCCGRGSFERRDETREQYSQSVKRVKQTAKQDTGLSHKGQKYRV